MIVILEKKDLGNNINKSTTWDKDGFDTSVVNYENAHYVVFLDDTDTMFIKSNDAPVLRKEFLIDIIWRLINGFNTQDLINILNDIESQILSNSRGKVFL